MKNNIKNSRRRFIKHAGIAAMGISTPFSSLLKLQSLNKLIGSYSNPLDNSGYKALVCLFQAGGNDAFNMLVPRGNTEYNEYATTRSNLALPQDELLSITANNPDGKLYGLHPSFGNIQQLFNDNKLSFISNIGTIIQPTTKEEFFNESVPLPLGLFSHADQQQQWMNASPHERIPIGWGGKLADIMSSQNNDSKISMNISLSGTNVFQYGNNTIEFSVDTDGSAGIIGYGQQWGIDPNRTAAIDSLFNYDYNDIYRNTYSSVIRDARDGSIEFGEAIENAPTLNTEFSDNYLSRQFAMIAKIMSVKESLGVQRQIFYVQVGGYDNHDELLDNQSANLAEVNAALSEFAQALEELNIFENVTTFSLSEFGRTLTSNGNGTDHAWGGNVMMMGGAVNGGNMFGTYPSLEIDSDLDVGGGALIPTTSTDLYFAELALWFGASPSDLPNLFPNLNNFYDINSPDLPIGFLNI